MASKILKPTTIPNAIREAKAKADTKAKAAGKPQPTAYRVNDGEGLYLRVKKPTKKADGKDDDVTKWPCFWRFDYVVTTTNAEGVRVKSKPTMRGYGQYPAVTIAKARELAAADRKKIVDGKCPVKAERDAKAKPEKEFGAVFERFMDIDPVGKSAAHKRRYLLSILTGIAHMQAGNIETTDVTRNVKKIKADNGDGTAHRALSLVIQVLAIAKSEGLVKVNVAEGIRTALGKRPESSERAALVKEPDVRRLMLAIHDYKGHQVNKVIGYALRLLALTMVRPGELRGATWDELKELDNGIWTIPASRMKMRKEHTIYLSKQAKQLFEELRDMTGGNGYVFRNFRTANRPISDNACNAALRTLGFTSEEHCSHGFRSTASTLLNTAIEAGEIDFSPDLVELALAHKVGGTDGKVRSIYNRADYVARRRAMMQWLADKLDSLRTGEPMPEDDASNVEPIKRSA